jgi:hypothetical protein
VAAPVIKRGRGATAEISLRRSLWKYNVDPYHLDICIKNSVFAEDINRNLVPGDLLLLQQLKQRVRNQHRRITHILEFERREADRGGVSTRLWGKAYRLIIYGRMLQLGSPLVSRTLS